MMSKDEAKLEMTEGYLAEDLREAIEEPVPCPRDPRAKKNVIKYKPPMVCLTNS